MQNPRKLRVLVVDDEPAIRRVLSRALSERYELHIVSSGEVALTMLALADFDVVVCDMSLRGMRGVDLYERARELHPHLATRFVFMTGGMADSRDPPCSAAVPVLRKPFALGALAEVIESVAGRGPCAT